MPRIKEQPKEEKKSQDSKILSGRTLKPARILYRVQFSVIYNRITYWTFNWKFCQNYPTAKSLQSCPTLCDPIDGSPPGSPVPGILQARILEWVAISFSNAWKWKVKVKSLSRVRLFATPWTAAFQAPLPMGFSRQEYWSGVPLPSPKTILVSDKNSLAK